MTKIELEGAKVNKFVFAPIQGQAIKCGFRVQLQPDDEELLQLSHALLNTAELHISAVLGYQGDDAGSLLDDDEDDDQDDGED